SIMRCRDFGSQDHSTVDADAFARKRKNPCVVDAMPASARDNGDTGFDDSAVEITHEVLSDAARHDLKASVGQAGTKRGPLTVERSEEHTSELQSRDHLVCRLLLEKK